jgi:hypothetical protein
MRNSALLMHWSLYYLQNLEAVLSNDYRTRIEQWNESDCTAYVRTLLPY